MAEAARLENHVFGGRFFIEAVAGVGGMAVVYRARDQLRGEVVALKILHDADPGALARFELEAKALEKLRDPHVVQYITHGVVAEGDAYLAMEWVDGETLHARLRRGPLEVRDVLSLACRLAEALESAHALGIVHRDIKPGNVLLPAKDVPRAKLADFGLAQTFDIKPPDREMPARTVVGTPGYMAPEQAHGAATLDGRSDLFSLGCLLFRCLTGVEAFEETPDLSALARTVLLEPPRVSELRPEISDVLDQLVARLLAKNPDERPVSATVLRAELECIAADPDVASPALPSDIQTLESATDLCFGRYVLEDRPTRTTKMVRARDSLLGRSVMLRVFGHMREPNAVAQWLEKVRAVATSNHPNIAAIHDMGVHAGVPFVATECVAGEALRTYIKDPSVDLGRRIRCLCSMARGLAAAHRAGAIHGDVNLDNVIVVDDSRVGNRSEDVVKIVDFEFVKHVRGKPMDARVDPFAWGVSAIELLASNWTQVPAEVAAVIDRASHDDSGQRFPTMDALLEALDASLRPPDSVQSASNVSNASRSPGRRRAALTAALALFVAVGASMFPSGRREVTSPASTQASPHAAGASPKAMSYATAPAQLSTEAPAVHATAVESRSEGHRRMRLPVTIIQSAPSDVRTDELELDVGPPPEATSLLTTH